MPLILGICCYVSIPFFNAAGSQAWLGFWGGYLGSIIMSGVTLYVLDNQLAQNHKENLCNAVLQIATLTNNEEKSHIDLLADSLVDFQSSFDFMTINQVAERMLKGEFLASDVEVLNQLVRDIDVKSFKINILLKPIPESEYIKRFNVISNQLYHDYGLLIGDFIFFIDLIKDLPRNSSKAKSYILQEIKKNKEVEDSMSPRISDIPGYKKQVSIIDIIEKHKFYEDIMCYTSEIIQTRLLQAIKLDSHLQESLKSIIIDLVNHEYKCINENFNEKIKVYAET